MFSPQREQRTNACRFDDLELMEESDLMTEGSVGWILEVKAPLSGPGFYAIFGVEVRARR